MRKLCLREEEASGSLNYLGEGTWGKRGAIEKQKCALRGEVGKQVTEKTRAEV